MPWISNCCNKLVDEKDIRICKKCNNWVCKNCIIDGLCLKCIEKRGKMF